MLTLTIENTECLPKQVPACMHVPNHGCLAIGRNSELSWTLPDPHRFISGRHCEIYDRAGTYWLYDLSTNGTFINGGHDRIRAAQPLRHGDRIAIGIYVIAVTIEPEPTVVGRFPPATEEAACCTDQPFQYDRLRRMTADPASGRV